MLRGRVDDPAHVSHLGVSGPSRPVAASSGGASHEIGPSSGSESGPLSRCLGEAHGPTPEMGARRAGFGAMRNRDSSAGIDELTHTVSYDVAEEPAGDRRGPPRMVGRNNWGQRLSADTSRAKQGVHLTS